MTDQNHPITPSKALEHKWASMFEQHSDMEVFTEVAQWGADQELEACTEWLAYEGHEHEHLALRAARRPKPPSLKEQALEAQMRMWSGTSNHDDRDLVRRALEQLPDAL